MGRRFAYATSFGANLIAPDRTRFALWAPDCNAVALEIEGAAPIPMTREEGGRFSADASCGAGARYRYRVRPDLAVPDPASRYQAGDVHDASVVVDPGAYAWENDAWRGRPWHETVLYEAHVGALGGFAGAANFLSELAALGVTALELMPIADFPGRRNWGYDGVLAYAPDAAYGAPAALKQLVDRAHGLGLMVFLDVVYNHFGPEGNYLAQYASGFFRDDRDTPWGSAIDFRRAEVRRFFIENALYWLLEYRFDGLRFDAVHAISDPDFLRELARSVRGAVEPERHVHLVLENDNNAADLLRAGERGLGFDAQWSDDAHHALHVLLTGERSGYYADYPDPAASLARCLSEGFAYQGEASAYRGGRPRGQPSAHLPPTAFVAFLQNHDQTGNRAAGERLTTLADPEALRAAKLLLLLAPQIPLLFMGEEWGETRPFLFFTDHPPELAAAVKRGREAEFKSFTTASGAFAVLSDPNDPATFACSTPQFWQPRTEPEAAERTFHERLLALRATHIVPFLPRCRAIEGIALGPASLSAAWRLGNRSVLSITANFGRLPLAVVPGEGQPLAESRPGALERGLLAPRSAAAWLSQPEAAI